MHKGFAVLILLCAAWAQAETPENKGCVVEGMMTRHGVPLQRETVTLMRKRDNDDSWETTTDRDGRYRFDGVAPGEYTVGYEVPKRREWGGRFSGRGSTYNHVRTFLVEQGDTAVQVPAPAQGHTLSGKMVAPAGCAFKIAWRGCDARRLHTVLDWPKPKRGESPEAHSKAIDAYRKTKAYRKKALRWVFLVPEISKDGSFKVRDVPPGEYDLFIEVGNDESDSGDAVGVATARFKMPNKSFDLPPVTVRLFDSPANQDVK